MGGAKVPPAPQFGEKRLFKAPISETLGNGGLRKVFQTSPRVKD